MAVYSVIAVVVFGVIVGGVSGPVVNEETALKPVPSALVENIWKS